MKVKSESEVAQSCPTPSDTWTAAHQAPPSMGFPDQEYYSELPFPAPSSALIQEKFPAEYVITSLGSPFLWGCTESDTTEVT